MDVNSSGSPEVVIPPHLTQQLLSGEDALRVTGQESQKFELFEGQVECASIDFGLVADLVDRYSSGRNHLILRVFARSGGQEANAGINLTGASVRENNIVKAPLAVECWHSSLVHSNQESCGEPGGGQNATQSFGSRQILASINHHNVGGRGIHQGCGLSRNGAHAMGELTQCGEDAGAFIRAKHKDAGHGPDLQAASCLLTPG